jgi:hypothetical protein
MAFQGEADTLQRKACEACNFSGSIETGKANCREIGYTTEGIASFPDRLFQATAAWWLLLGL